MCSDAGKCNGPYQMLYSTRQNIICVVVRMCRMMGVSVREMTSNNILSYTVIATNMLVDYILFHLD